MTDHAAARARAADSAWPEPNTSTHWWDVTQPETLPPLESMPPTSWTVDAACRGMNTELFFPPKGKGCEVQVAEAKAICAICPVKAECLADTLAYEPSDRYRYGIRGGLTARERRGMHRPITRDTCTRESNAGWAAHWRRGESPCEGCRLAHNRYVQDQKRGRSA